MNSILTIIQARQNSSRLPNKVLENFSGNSLIWHIIDRLKHSKYINKIIVATGPKELNSQLVEACEKNLGVEVFCGDDFDVLDRFYHAAKPYSPDIIVRVTADDPLKDAAVVDRAIEIILQSDKKYDYVSNTLKPTYPEGLDIEVFKFSALERAFNEAKLPSEREHVTPFIWKHSQKFNLHNFEYEQDLSHLRLTVDYPDDLDFVKKIYSNFEKNNYFAMQDILDFLEKNHSLSRTNKDIERNQSYNEMTKNEQK